MNKFLTEVLKEENPDFYKNYLVDRRRSSRTTRLVNEAIDELYEKGSVELRDHYDSPNATIYLLNKVLYRLHNEHSHMKYSHKGNKVFLSKIKNTLLPSCE